MSFGAAFSLIETGRWVMPLVIARCPCSIPACAPWSAAYRISPRPVA